MKARMFLQKLSTGLKKKLRIMATGKRLVIFSSIFALLGTVLVVRTLRGKESEIGDEEDFQAFFEEALQGKRAISISVSASDIPAELMYPGVRVDILEKGKSKNTGIIEDVLVLSMSVLDENSIKVTLALTDEEGKKINTLQPNELTLMVRGKGGEHTKDNKDDDIEIIEL